MNKRIRQLAEQANIEFTYDPTETPMRAFAECWEDELEKFAELIVRECMKVAVYKDSGYMHPADVAGYMAAGRSTAASLIKEHFGVEE